MKTYVTETNPNVYLLPMNVGKVDVLVPREISKDHYKIVPETIDLSPPEYRGIKLPTYLEVRP